MNAARLTRPGLEFLRLELDRNRENFFSDWHSRLVSAIPDGLEPLGFTIPEIPFSTMGTGKTNDATAAYALYRSLPSRLLGKSSFDVGFWAWLSLSSEAAKQYLLKRWTDQESYSVRFLGQREIRQGLFRLWLGSHIVANDSSEIPEKYIADLFKKQDVFEACIGRSLFREPSLAREYVSICVNRELTSEELRAFAKRINFVMGTRFLPALGHEELGRELDEILKFVLKSRRTN